MCSVAQLECSQADNSSLTFSDWSPRFIVLSCGTGIPAGRQTYIARLSQTRERWSTRKVPGRRVYVSLRLQDSCTGQTPYIVLFLCCVRESECVTGEMLPASEWLQVQWRLRWKLHRLLVGVLFLITCMFSVLTFCVVFRVSSSFVSLLGLSSHDKWKQDPTQVQGDKRYSDLRNIAVQSGCRIRGSSANSNKSRVTKEEYACLVWSALVIALQTL